MATTTTTIAETIASYCASLTYDDIPPETLHKAKGLLIDSLGCALGGYTGEPAKIARKIAGRVLPCDLPATILGSGQQSSLELATFANGVMIRFLDFNDGFQGKGGGHPSDNFAPIITCADAVHAGGKEVILSAVLAYEIYCRMSDQYEVYERGFDHCVNGVISCAMGASKILGLSQAEMVQAINLALAPNISLGQTRVGEVSMWKGAAMANAARNAVFATLLAREGMTGPSPVFYVLRPPRIPPGSPLESRRTRRGTAVSGLQKRADTGSTAPWLPLLESVHPQDEIWSSTRDR